MRRWIAVLPILVGVLATPGTGWGISPTVYGWSSDTRAGALDGEIRCMAPYAGGLAIGGAFTSAGDVPLSRVGVWNGATSLPLGEGFDNTVTHLIVHRGELIAGGLFTASGGDSVSHIARWDGAAWREIGGGLHEAVTALASDGENLYAATYPQVVPCESYRKPCAFVHAVSIARWDGQSWQWLEDNDDFSRLKVLTATRALLVHDGTLIAAATVRAGYGPNTTLYPAMIRRDGVWYPFGPGVVEAGSARRPNAHLLLDDGDGILMAGRFPGYDDLPFGVSRLLRWDGATWASVDPGFLGHISALDRVGSRVYLAAMTAVQGKERWTPGGWVWTWVFEPGTVLVRSGSTWEHVADEVDGLVHGVGIAGGRVTVGGAFAQIGDVKARGLATMEPSGWAGLPEGANTRLPGPLVGLEVWNDRLVATLSTSHDVRASQFRWWSIVSRTEDRWEVLDESDPTLTEFPESPPFQITDRIAATWEIQLPMLEFQGRLVAGTESSIRVRDEAGWTVLANHDGRLTALGSWRGVLIAGGSFHRIDGNEAHAVALWTGEEWQALGNGLGDPCESRDDEACWDYNTWFHRRFYRIRALAEFRDDLIAGGAFLTADDLPANNIARWDGTAWYALGDGLDDLVTDVQVYGGELYAAGFFTASGDRGGLNHVARWDGATWQPVGLGTDGPVFALDVYNGKLVAAGLFRHADGQVARNIAAWDGLGWLPLDSGTNGAVNDLLVRDGVLWLGGEFTEAGGLVAVGVARWTEPLDGPAVTILSPRRVDDTVVVQWGVTAASPEHAGFHVYRRPYGEDWTRLNPELLTGGPEFTFVDGSPSVNPTEYQIAAVTRTGEEYRYGSLSIDASLDIRFALGAGRPNPFRPAGGAAARIAYRLPVEGRVLIRILDAAGREVAVVADTNMPAGEYEATWDGRDRQGRIVGAGVYFMRLDGVPGTLTQKLVVVN